MTARYAKHGRMLALTLIGIGMAIGTSASGTNAAPFQEMPAIADPVNGAAASRDPFVDFLMLTARESCYAIGDDEVRLKELAIRNKWAVPSPAMLEQFNHPSYKLLNGWTFEAHNRAFALQQTENAADRSRSCSITTKLISEREYEEFKSAWDRSFTLSRHDDRITSARWFHLDAMIRPPSTSIASTLSFDLKTRAFTVLITAMPSKGSYRGPFHGLHTNPNS